MRSCRLHKILWQHLNQLNRILLRFCFPSLPPTFFLSLSISFTLSLRVLFSFLPFFSVRRYEWCVSIFFIVATSFSLSLSLNVLIFLSPSLSFYSKTPSVALSLCYTHTHTHTPTHSFFDNQTYSVSLSLTHTLTNPASTPKLLTLSVPSPPLSLSLLSAHGTCLGRNTARKVLVADGSPVHSATRSTPTYCHWTSKTPWLRSKKNAFLRYLQKQIDPLNNYVPIEMFQLVCNLELTKKSIAKLVT